MRTFTAEIVVENALESTDELTCRLSLENFNKKWRVPTGALSRWTSCPIAGISDVDFNKIAELARKCRADLTIKFTAKGDV